MSKVQNTISGESQKDTHLPAESDKPKYYSLNLEGTIYKTLFSRKFEIKKKWTRPNPRRVTSFIPGTILKVLVSPGDRLNAGDDLVILQAMKMQNRVKTVVAGKVKKINVNEGDKVPKGFVMVEME